MRTWSSPVTVQTKKLAKPTSRKQQGLPGSTRAFRHLACSDTNPVLGASLHARPALCRDSQRATPPGQPGGSGTLLKDRKTHQLKIVCSRSCKVRSVYLSRLSNKRVIAPEGLKLVKPKHAYLPRSPLSKGQRNPGALKWVGDTQTRCIWSLVCGHWAEGAELLHKTIIFVDVTLHSYIM